MPKQRACLVALCTLLWWHVSEVASQAPDHADDQMLSLLKNMVTEDPSRADSWRLIGRIYRKQGKLPDAFRSFQRALAEQPDNVAAHSDMGDLMEQVGKRDAAEYHFDQVMKLGATSSYAEKLVARGIRDAPQLETEKLDVPEFNNAGNIETVGYEIQTFDGADDLDRRLNQLDADIVPPPNRLRAFIEFGAMYNTNVALTPISRELTGNQAASFQGFFSPDMEWIAVGPGPWRMGPLLRGYFTKNEDDFRSLDLASFQPGSFIERDLMFGPTQVIGRVDYVYSLDFLDADRFGDRHALTASLTKILPNANVVYSYFTTSYSNFTNDGATASVDSLDGLALTGGVSNFHRTDWSLLPTWTFGIDGEWANTEGADFRYRAINFHTDATLQFTPWLSFTPRAGIGYRNYPDFTGAINRDELTWRLSGKLRWQLSQWFAVSAVVGLDRFASDNEDFDTERTEGGIVFTVIR